MAELPPVNVRPYNPGTDLSFVLDSWKLSHHDTHLVRAIPWDSYQSEIVPHMKRVLACADVLVAAWNEDDQELCGWVAFSFSAPALYWLYVKAAFRRFGIGSHLLDCATGGTRSGRCAMWSQAATRWPGLVYHPKLLEEKIR